MRKKRTASLFLVVALLFTVASSISAQESADEIMARFIMPENSQDAISRFPANLQNGFQGMYIVFTGYLQQSEQGVFELLVSYLMVNYIKTNIILTGKGNERMANGMTYSQFYADGRAQLIVATGTVPMMVQLSGNPGGTNWDIWGDYFLEWL